ncbi:MAG TPA: carbohydrate ABC transporter permease, partial [Thermomicrobiales bacterium]|nr:carbohydrate ABC transporter permease [Thermomicrobiales bacterium]
MSTAIDTTRSGTGIAANDAIRARRRSRQYLLGRGLLYVAAVLLAIWVLLPIYLIGVVAFSTSDAVYDYPKELIPSGFSVETVDFFINATGVLPALWRSVLVAVISLVLSTLIGAPAGYAIARYAFRGRDAFRILVLSTRAFPIVILSIPLAVTFINWGIYDSVFSVALMHTALALPFTILITSSIFVSVPRDLE